MKNSLKTSIFFLFSFVVESPLLNLMSNNWVVLWSVIPILNTTCTSSFLLFDKAHYMMGMNGRGPNKWASLYLCWTTSYRFKIITCSRSVVKKGVVTVRNTAAHIKRDGCIKVDSTECSVTGRGLHEAILLMTCNHQWHDRKRGWRTQFEMPWGKKKAPFLWWIQY